MYIDATRWDATERDFFATTALMIMRDLFPLQETLFPYVRQNLKNYIETKWEDEEFKQDYEKLKEQVTIRFWSELKEQVNTKFWAS